MFSFPRFKNRQSAGPYKSYALKNWENMVWKTGLVFLIIEVAKLIEDFNHGKYTVWSVLWISKAVNIGFYFFVTFGRCLIVKLMKRYKRLFVNLSEIFILVFFIMVTIYGQKLPRSTPDPNPFWVSKESLAGYIRIIGLCFSFYNWFLPILIIATTIGYSSYNYVKLLPGSEKIYMPTYFSIILIIGILCYVFEQMSRANFEAHLEANMKEKVWKEILNEFPEGTVVITEKKEVLYVNHAFYSILNMDFQKGFEGIAGLKHLKDISIEGFSTNSSAFGQDYNPITKFQDLQDLIWSQWSSLVDYFSSPLPHDEYKIFRGQYQIDENRSKTFEIKFTIRNFGGRNVALFIFSDVSERLLVGYLKQSIEYKNRLLASVSHELRTPLNGNINFIQEAIHDPAVPQQIKESRLIPAVRSAQYLLVLINDILDFSQIQAQNLRLVPTAKNIVDTVKEAMQLVEIQAKKKGLYLTLDLSESTWHYEIKTDHNRVLQIVANLLSNALKFTFSGGITITMKPEKNHNICIEVADTGIGIKQEDQSKLFKTFGKLDLGGKNYINSQGVGLGLVISNSLARMLGPKQDTSDLQIMFIDLDDDEKNQHGIYFESEFGKGTKFWFRIADQNEKQSYTQRIVPSEGSHFHDIPEFILTEVCVPLKPATCQCSDFLVADDDAFNILTLETMLNGLGYRSDCVYNGQHVIDLLMQRISSPCSDTCLPYKMIFLDCNMPIMDGYECATNIKKIFAEYPEYECPVIACTAATHQAERDKALESGMGDFVTKPVSKSRIQELINFYCIRPSSSESPF